MGVFNSSNMVFDWGPQCSAHQLANMDNVTKLTWETCTSNVSDVTSCTSSEISASSGAASVVIIVASLVGIAFAVFQFTRVSAISLDYKEQSSDDMNAHWFAANKVNPEHHEKLKEIYEIIREGASSFLKAEYLLCFIFIFVFGLVVLFLTSFVNRDETTFNNPRAATMDGLVFTNHVDAEKWDFSVGALTALSFAVGGITSIVSGYIGMEVAVFANARCTVQASNPNSEVAWTSSFNAAFQAGSVMGFSLCGLALGMLFILIHIFAAVFEMDFDVHTSDAFEKSGQTLKITTLFECIAGYGLGGSCIALFGRVGGGIYTKAADVGADLAGKVVHGIPEDDPRNPAVIADNVGDNVGDVAGMGSDLFGSFAEATCAALVISTQYPSFDFLIKNDFVNCFCDGHNSVHCVSATPFLIESGFPALMFPLLISAVSIFVCMVTSFLATHVWTVKKEDDVETVLKVQLAVTCVLMLAVMIPLCAAFLPAEFVLQGVADKVSRWDAYLCVACGLVGGCAIGFITEYYTSHSYAPVRDVAASCETGAATNIIFGLALGYKSCILPISIIALNVFFAFKYAGMYGVALSALGFLGTLSTCLSIDVYGPVCDNAGGLAEMSHFPESVRDKTDALDATGNTTAAIGKGFAIGSAALVSLALFGGFQARVSGHLNQDPTLTYNNLSIVIDILQPITFAFLFIGAMLPYAFTAFTMKSVGVAANEMVLPGLLVILPPILTGILFGIEGVCGLLVGGLTSGVQLAISQSNAGGAWDNAKKYVECGKVILATKCPLGQAPEVDAVVAQASHLPNVEALDNTVSVYYRHGKKSEVHKSAVVGDTVGDPLKDTSGPALNILMKLMAIIS